MASKIDVAEIRDELVQAVKEGDEQRARALVPRLGVNPRQVRAELEAMLEDSFGLVRQAAVFGLGQLGGKASVRRLEQQLAIEEARGDYDGEAVVEDITRALGRMEETGTRAILVRRLERLSAGKPERSDVYDIARMLWRKRHPDLIPCVRRGLEQISLVAPHGLHGLLVLLEKSPEELSEWARDPKVSVEEKTRVLAVLEEEVPDTLVPTLPAFIAAAAGLSEQAMHQKREVDYFVDCLCSLLLMDRERFIVAQPPEVRGTLRSVARSLIAATFPNPSNRAAVVLGLVGQPEDAAFLLEHCPAYPTLAQVFQDAARALRDKN